MKIKNISVTSIFMCLMIVLKSGTPSAGTAVYNVLVVMSYGPDYAFVQEVKQGIESTLADTCRTKYFYLDTKKDFPGGPQKAKQAYEFYKRNTFDGVIAADDDAQSMFVVPYLKNKVKTPVMFCGVNAGPEKYGYPAANVSGILERHPVSQTLAFAKQLIPSAKTFGLMVYDNPSGQAALEVFRREEDTFTIQLVTARFPKTFEQAQIMAKELKPLCDILYMPTMHGIKDDQGNPLPEKSIVPEIARTFGKPLISGNHYNIRYGMLCGVVKTGQEQGVTAAKMLLKAMEGTPVSRIPITRNRLGKATINVTVMKALGITPKPILLKGTELVRTEP